MKSDDPLVDEFLKHYANPYYDPAKAHEYYMRTRKLKDREKSSARAENARIANSGKTPTKPDPAREALDKTVEKLRERAEKRVDAISRRIQAKLERVAERTKKQAEKISRETFEKIERLPKIPENVSPETRARLQRARSARIAQIRGDGQRAVQKTRESGRSDSDATRKAAREKLSSVGGGLKDAITQARTDYSNAVGRTRVEGNQRRDADRVAAKAERERVAATKKRDKDTKKS